MNYILNVKDYQSETLEFINRAARDAANKEAKRLESDAMTFLELGYSVDDLQIIYRKGDYRGEVTTKRATEGMPYVLPPSDEDW